MINRIQKMQNLLQLIETSVDTGNFDEILRNLPNIRNVARGSNMFSISLNDFIHGGLLNPLSINPTKWSNTLKQFVGKSRRIV